MYSLVNIANQVSILDTDDVKKNELVYNTHDPHGEMIDNNTVMECVQTAVTVLMCAPQCTPF